MKFAWADYFIKTAHKEPSPLLAKAIALLGHTGNALDLGCGAGRDTKLLLEKGFTVTAVDYDPQVEHYIKNLPQEKITYYNCRFADFTFPANQYDIVNASFSLPFTHRDAFAVVFKKMKDSIKSGGFFCGQLFGVNDEWNQSGKSTTTFHTKEQAEMLFNDMKIMMFKERDYDGTLADGTSKHWHAFHIIARKKSLEKI